MATKADLYRYACDVNALRKEGNLPLRDIRQMIAEAEVVRAWREHAEAIERHRAVYEQLRDYVRQKYRDSGKGDLMLSRGGQWLLAYRASKLFDYFLSELGHARPPVRAIRYRD